MTGSEVRKRVVLSPIALAVAIGVAAHALLPLPWSPIESAKASHPQCAPVGGGGAADSGGGGGGGFDSGCCECSTSGDGGGGGDGGK